MSASNRRPGDDEAGHDLEQPAVPKAEAGSPPTGSPFDWQVLLLRYLPQPVGSTHVIKRLAPR